MVNKYAKIFDVKKFYYALDSCYCVVIAKDRESIKSVRESVLDKYLGNCHEYHQKQFIAGKKGTMAGQLIHLIHSIAERIGTDTNLDNIDLELCPVDFNDHNMKKAGLIRLIKENS